jgi:GR25 family glycosyltransferase involved in LPS biosynthesis
MKYTIMHVDNRAQKNMDHNKNILKGFEYVDGIDFVNGNKIDAWKILEDNDVNIYAWNPYDGRTSEALPGEYGVMASTLNLWKYIVDNKIDILLVLEDDIMLQDDFVEKFNKCLNDLPKNFDLLSLYYFSDQNWVNQDTEIGSEYIHKSNNQYSAAQAILYSYMGAKKLIKLLKRKGYEYTNDCFIYRQAHEGLVNSYSIKKENDYFLKHDYKNIKSLIDPTNFRNTDVL